MKLRDVGYCLLGSSAIYVAMAACSAGGGGTSSMGVNANSTGSGVRSTGPGGGSGNTSTSTNTSAHSTAQAGGSGSPADSGLFDALTNPVPDASAEPQNGSRLKAEYRLADDGSKEYLSGVWFDSMRNETCAFTTAADGKERCLPEGVATSIYSDSHCTTPLIVVTSGCAAPPYALTANASTCGDQSTSGIHISPLGASATPATLYVKVAGNCSSAGAATTGYDYFSVGAEIPATSFVASATQHD